MTVSKEILTYVHILKLALSLVVYLGIAHYCKYYPRLNEGTWFERLKYGYVNAHPQVRLSANLAIATAIIIIAIQVFVK